MNKLKPFIDEPGLKFITCFKTTTRIYFPFFTCEFKCGNAALDFADCQNAQSMSIALRGIVTLFKHVKRERELGREVLVFSISHDHACVRIYGHCSVIQDDRIGFYRHRLDTYDFTARMGERKWSTYRFVRNLYEHHAPKLHRLICSAIDDLSADVSFDLPQSVGFSESTTHASQPSDVDEEALTFGNCSTSSAVEKTTPVAPAS